MSSHVVSPYLVRRLLPGVMVIALFLGLLVPSAVQAAPAGKQDKPAVEQMQGRTVYRGNPWAVSQPSCSSNRYYAQNPQRRYPPRTSVNWQQNNAPRQYNDGPHKGNQYNYHQDRCDGFYYQVRRGDTLSGIARRYGVSQQALANANHLRNANRISAGQRLYIPASGYCR